MPKDIPHERFERALAEIINEQPASHLLSIPGIWEVLSEHYNNDVLDAIKAEDETNADSE